METPKIIGENEINLELTEKVKKDPKYDAYRTWLKEKGVLWKDIDFPVAFGPSGVIGVAASKDIPNSQAIICVPNKILITTTKVKNGELKDFVNEFPEIFHNHEDADFSLLTIFLLREKIKGSESDYQPLINVIDNNAILLHWHEDIIHELEDPYIKKETEEFELDMDRTWEQFREAFQKYPQFFPLDKFSKQDFLWCYEAVMTRCFGWSLPTTMLVPMADFMNHNPDGTTSYIVNTRFEKKEEEAPENYLIKKRKVDLAVFEDSTIVLSKEEKEIFHVSPGQRITYIKNNLEYLSQKSAQRVEANDYRKEDLKKFIREINLAILKKDKNKQVWELAWFESSDEEDNDTEEEDNDEDEEQDTGKKAFEEVHQQELDTLTKSKETATATTEASKKQEELKVDNIKVIKTSNQGNENDDADDEDEEEDDDEEENLQRKKEKENYTFGKGIVNENFSPTKYMRNSVSAYEKEEMEKIHHKNSGIKVHKSDAQNDEEEEEDEDEDDSDWEWFEDDDNDNYFIVATHSRLSYKKGDQIFNCYGRRTNRFLLMWYGFCLQDNRYNSLSFRLWMNKSTLSNTNPPKKILFKDYISEKEWTEKEVGEEKSSPKDLTKEFRIKIGTFCADVLAYLRAQLLLTYKGTDLQRVMVTIPTSIPYEEFVIDYAISMFIEIKNQYKTSMYQDEELLKDRSMDFRKRFAVVYRYEQKRIADLQIQLLKIVLNITQRLKAGVFFKDAYMEYVPDIDRTDDEFIEHRRRLAGYLKLFYHNYTV